MLLSLFGCTVKRKGKKKKNWKCRGKEINKEIDNYITNLLNSIEKEKIKGII